MFANIIVEIPYSIFAGVLAFACFFYPVVGTSLDSERQGLVLLFMIELLVFTSTLRSPRSRMPRRPPV
jgi:ATP-binding cassette, subfamily G (WHITE), member 2, PDR